MTSLWRSDVAPWKGTPFQPNADHEVIVIGAGITGLSTALMLLRAGFDVAVVEAGDVGELATGGNTGKVSLLQGSVLSTLRRHHPASLVRAYVESNRDGMEWLTGFMKEARVPHTRRTVYSYAQSEEGVDTVSAELAAAREAGLPVAAASVSGEEGFPIAAAVGLDDQIAVDPQQVALALARAIVHAGGVIHTDTRVRRVHVVPSPRIETESGDATANQIVVATGSPIMDRGLYFSKMSGLRSYCVAFAYEGAVPDAMYLSVDSPTRSIRSVTAEDGPALQGSRLVVGGNGHPVGRTDSEQAKIDDLIDWTRRHFPGAEPLMSWSAQDYQSHNLIPFVGVMPRSLGRVRFATGFGKWGLSNGPAAALRLTAEIRRVPRRDRPDWMNVYSRRMTVPEDVVRGAAEGLKVAKEAATGWVGAFGSAVPVPRPAEGVGIVAHRGALPVGVSTVDGTTRAVSAVCPHLGGVLEWNDADCTWDCPLHASRFAADGERIEGPATSDLPQLPRTGR